MVLGNRHYIFAKVFSPILVENLDNSSNVTGMAKDATLVVVYAVGGFLPICTPYQAGVEYGRYSCYSLVQSAQPECTESAPHFCLLF